MTTTRYCVIGAGTCGLAAAKNLRERGIDVDVVDREDDVGGNWYYGSPSSTVYDSAHLISSKRLAGYLDFPMPDHYPDYPGHRDVLAYLRAYAREFGVYDDIELGRSVTAVVPADDGWDVTLDDTETRRYRGVVVANGHHRVPRFPQLPGTFTGEQMHAGQYRRPEQLAGRRVLVVGGGNSGCDIAVDLIPLAAGVLHSMRRGYHFWPKFFMGRPMDEVNELTLKLRLPVPLRRVIAGSLLRALVGRNARYGLPDPDHRMFETNLIINSRLLYHLRHGDITPKPDVSELRGDRVAFRDGSEEEVDAILYATGYDPVFPFLNDAGLEWRDGVPSLHLHLAHPRRDDFFVLGMIQPDVGIWRLADQQARLVARIADARDRAPEALAAWSRRKGGRHPSMTPYRYVDSPRHRLEVEHTRYERLLRHEIRRFDRALGASPARVTGDREDAAATKAMEAVEAVR